MVLRPPEQGVASLSVAEEGVGPEVVRAVGAEEMSRRGSRRGMERTDGGARRREAAEAQVRHLFTTDCRQLSLFRTAVSYLLP